MTVKWHAQNATLLHLLQAYEALEDRVREGDASTSGGGPKVVERQWLRVHVDLSLADSLDEDPLVRCALGLRSSPVSFRDTPRPYSSSEIFDMG